MVGLDYTELIKLLLGYEFINLNEMQIKFNVVLDVHLTQRLSDNVKIMQQDKDCFFSISSYLEAFQTFIKDPINEIVLSNRGFDPDWFILHEKTHFELTKLLIQNIHDPNIFVINNHDDVTENENIVTHTFLKTIDIGQYDVSQKMSQSEFDNLFNSPFFRYTNNILAYSPHTWRPPPPPRVRFNLTGGRMNISSEKYATLLSARVKFLKNVCAHVRRTLEYKSLALDSEPIQLDPPLSENAVPVDDPEFLAILKDQHTTVEMEDDPDLNNADIEYDSNRPPAHNKPSVPLEYEDDVEKDLVIDGFPLIPTLPTNPTLKDYVEFVLRTLVFRCIVRLRQPRQYEHFSVNTIRFGQLEHIQTTLNMNAPASSVPDIDTKTKAIIHTTLKMAPFVSEVKMHALRLNPEFSRFTDQYHVHRFIPLVYFANLYFRINTRIPFKPTIPYTADDMLYDFILFLDPSTSREDIDFYKPHFESAFFGYDHDKAYDCMHDLRILCVVHEFFSTHVHVDDFPTTMTDFIKRFFSTPFVNGSISISTKRQIPITNVLICRIIETYAASKPYPDAIIHAMDTMYPNNNRPFDLTFKRILTTVVPPLNEMKGGSRSPSLTLYGLILRTLRAFNLRSSP